MNNLSILKKKFWILFFINFRIFDSISYINNKEVPSKFGLILSLFILTFQRFVKEGKNYSKYLLYLLFYSYLLQH